MQASKILKALAMDFYLDSNKRCKINSLILGKPSLSNASWVIKGYYSPENDESLNVEN